jgi:hypothetical protein
MYDVWQDPDYEFAESKSERLLLAALDYSIHRHVVYVAAKPPRSIFRPSLARLGRTIMYIPIGQLSPASLKKIRVVHVLDGYDKREIAKDYRPQEDGDVSRTGAEPRGGFLMAYLLDANVFIAAKNLHYGLDFVAW